MNELNSNTNEYVVADLIDRIKCSRQGLDILVELLPRSIDLYKDRGTNQVNRIRGYAIAAFETLGLPDNALIYVCEELDNGHSPYLIAASAMAVRGYKIPNKEISTFLIKALKNLGHKDNAISFLTYNPQWPLQNYTTATHEILKSLAWLGVYAKETIPFLCEFSKENIISINQEIKELTLQTIEVIENDNRLVVKDCCKFPVDLIKNKSRVRLKRVKDIQLQDQDGTTIKFGDYFYGKISLLAFFYTRCDNPNRCSLTVTKLAQLQKLLQKNGLSDILISAITYDSNYDTPERLKKYSSNRGFLHNHQYKIFRVFDNQENVLQKYLNLNVNYNNSIVNHHSVELFVLNKQAVKIKEFSRIELDNTNILNFLKVECKKRSTRLCNIPTNIMNSMLPILLFFFPKCPLCWAGYLSLFGLSSISWLKYNSNLIWLLIILMTTSLILMYIKARKLGYYFPFKMSLTGYSILLPSIYLDIPVVIKYISVGVIILSSLMNTFNIYKWKYHLN